MHASCRLAVRTVQCLCVQHLSLVVWRDQTSMHAGAPYQELFRHGHVLRALPNSMLSHFQYGLADRGQGLGGPACPSSSYCFSRYIHGQVHGACACTEHIAAVLPQFLSLFLNFSQSISDCMSNNEQHRTSMSSGCMSTAGLCSGPFALVYIHVIALDNMCKTAIQHAYLMHRG